MAKVPMLVLELPLPEMMDKAYFERYFTTMFSVRLVEHREGIFQANNDPQVMTPILSNWLKNMEVTVKEETPPEPVI